MSHPARIGGTITERALSLVRGDSRLRRLPIRAGVVALLVALVLIGVGVGVGGLDVAPARRIASVSCVVVGAYLAAVSVVYFNAVLVVAAEQALGGEEPDLRSAHATARRRVGAIAAWAFVAGIAALVLGFVRLVGIAGLLFGSRLAARWGLRTYLVVPVMLLEGGGPLKGLQRSRRLITARWGPKAIGDVVVGGDDAAMGGLTFFLCFPGFALASWDVWWVKAIGALILVVCVTGAVIGAVGCGASRAVFGVALRRHLVAGDAVVGPFDARDFDSVGRQGEAVPAVG